MSEVVEKQRSGKSLTFWIRLLVAGGIVGFIVVNNDWGLFWKELSRARWEWLLAAFVSFGVCLLAGSWRWQQLLRVQSIRLPLSQTWLITMIGFFFNQFLIGSTGGDLVKGFYAIRQAPERKAKAALSIVMDRVMGLVAILAATFLLLPLEWDRLYTNADTRLILIFLALILSGVFVGLGVALFFPLSVLPGWVHRLWGQCPKREVLESLYDGLRAHGAAGWTMGWAVGASLTSAVPLLSTGWLLSQSLSLDIAYGPMTILFALVLCAMGIPLFPGGHGVREAAFLLFFGVFTVTRSGVPVGEETALACSTLFLLITLSWSLLGGSLYLFLSGKIKRTEADV